MAYDDVKRLFAQSRSFSDSVLPSRPAHIHVKKLQFIHTVNGDGSKTAKIIKMHY